MGFSGAICLEPPFCSVGVIAGTGRYGKNDARNGKYIEVVEYQAVKSLLLGQIEVWAVEKILTDRWNGPVGRREKIRTPGVFCICPAVVFSMKDGNNCG